MAVRRVKEEEFIKEGDAVFVKRVYEVFERGKGPREEEEVKEINQEYIDTLISVKQNLEEQLKSLNERINKLQELIGGDSMEEKEVQEVVEEVEKQEEAVNVQQDNEVEQNTEDSESNDGSSGREEEVKEENSPEEQPAEVEVSLQAPQEQENPQENPKSTSEEESDASKEEQG